MNDSSEDNRFTLLDAIEAFTDAMAGIMERLVELATMAWGWIRRHMPGYEEPEEEVEDYDYDPVSIDRARERARTLLESHLTDEQKETFEKSDKFMVKAKDSGTYYVIERNTVNGLIAVIPDTSHKGKLWTLALLCVFPALRGAPTYDGMLQLKLMLESAGGEAMVLKKANVTTMTYGHDIPAFLARERRKYADRIARMSTR